MESKPWQPGERVGDYVLEERLGRGGMGSVFRARHLGTGAERALKTLTCGEPELLLRFQREARALAAAEHPHVVRVHAFEQHQGRPYLVTELLEGGDLERRLRAGPLEPRAAARLALELAEGLALVHERGVLHRDLKPANVLFDGEGRPKLADFGLARVQGADSLTATGELLGTPAYMSPEQARGARGAIDARSDVYGLGAILYACLSGRPPFQGATVLALLSSVLQDTPPPLGVDPGLAAVCSRALAKDPADRPADAAAFARELAAWLAGERPPRRQAPLLLGAGALLAAGLAALALGPLARRPAATPSPLAASSRPPAPPPPDASPAPTRSEAYLPTRALGVPRAPYAELVHSEASGMTRGFGDAGAALFSRGGALHLLSWGWGSTHLLLWRDGRSDQVAVPQGKPRGACVVEGEAIWVRYTNSGRVNRIPIPALRGGRPYEGRGRVTCLAAQGETLYVARSEGELHWVERFRVGGPVSGVPDWRCPGPIRALAASPELVVALCDEGAFGWPGSARPLDGFARRRYDLVPGAQGKRVVLGERELLIGDRAGGLHLWRLREDLSPAGPPQVWRDPRATGSVLALGLTPRWVAVAQGAALSLWRRGVGEPELKERVRRERVSEAALSPSGEVAALVRSDGRIELWDVRALAGEAELPELRRLELRELSALEREALSHLSGEERQQLDEQFEYTGDHDTQLEALSNRREGPPGHFELAGAARVAQRGSGRAFRRLGNILTRQPQLHPSDLERAPAELRAVLFHQALVQGDDDSGALERLLRFYQEECPLPWAAGAVQRLSRKAELLTLDPSVPADVEAAHKRLQRIYRARPLP